ncbi:hypothetical protein OSTOST_20484 [Ostertagia ostertagi]
MISIGVMVMLCVVLSITCVIVWMLRWRRSLVRKAGQADHQCDDEISYTENVKPRTKSSSKRAVADSVPSPARADSVEGEKSHRSSSYKCSTSAEQLKQDDIVAQAEPRPSQTYVSKPLERIKEEAISVKNKRLDTVSVMSSVETLQRNDSKVNVFPADKMEEIDLNPGLNNVINLETI